MILEPKSIMISRRELVPLERVRSSLSKVWFIGALILFAVMIAQSIMGHYGDEPKPAWTWFLGAITPTLTVILGALSYTALNPDRLKQVVRIFFYRLALVMSIIYLILIALTIAFEPFSSIEPFELMRVSNYWLVPVQSFVVTLISVLFFRAKPQGT